jgi:hypothetical protein
MGEQVFNSPGVKAQEIDLSGPRATTPQGIPAGVIGTSKKGPAFVPITVPNLSEFIVKFGDADSTTFGALAMKQWFANGQRSGTFMRVLGSGTGKKRTDSGDNTGKVTNAGFVVGERQVLDSGVKGNNPYAGTPTDSAGMEGRTFLFGCFMSESNYSSNVLRESGIILGSGETDSVGGPAVKQLVATGSKPILRGVLMTASGVIASLSSSYVAANNTALQTAVPYIAATRDDGAEYSVAQFGDTAGTNCAGSFVGTVDKSTNGGDKFVILLNGHKSAAGAPNVITASFDPQSPAYFANVLNKDPLAAQQQGHLLYAHWDIRSSFLVVTASNSALSGANASHAATDVYGVLSAGENAAFMVTASIARNSGTAAGTGGPSPASKQAGVPNFDGFEDRYRDAFSSWVVSQDFGDGPRNLFRLYALSDGVGNYNATAIDVPPERLKISIQNIKKSKNTKPGNNYGTFDLLIRDLHDNDREIRAYEKYINCNLDPTSEDYLGRKIGDMNTYFDWNREKRAQKLVVDGKYPNVSNFVRVEMANAVDQGTVGMDPTALPVGYRGPYHLLTSGSHIITAVTGNVVPLNEEMSTHGVSALSEITQLPLPYRRNLSVTKSGNVNADRRLYWGLQTTIQPTPAQPNKSTEHNPSVDSWTKYFPHFHTVWQNPWVGDNAGTADLSGSVLDSDRFCNNLFTLERVQVVKQSATVDLPDALEWAAARYRRNGLLLDLTKSDDTTATGRFLDVTKDFGDASTQAYLKFNLLMQGGFNGVNIFDKQKADLTNLAVRREFDDVSGQGGVENGPTIRAYRKALDILGDRSDADIKLLTIPGQRHPAVVDYAIDTVENRFDAMLIMDIEQKDSADTFVTASNIQLVDVTNTVRRFGDRNLDSSFAAAYFPDVRLQDTTTSEEMTVPPSVAVLGAFALNDTIGHPWFAPAGFTRGVLSNVLDMSVKLNQSNLDVLYETDINPINQYPGSSGPVVWGQKTLLKAQSALDRVNVRRLLIDVRRKVKRIADRILFEPNRASTLARFSAAVNPILAQIQAQQGLDRFKVQIDASTTTQADIENNTIRGKIFLQPTRSVEFIALDFVVTNTIDQNGL